jgi:DNA-binding FadR family transcriptional regulator
MAKQPKQRTFESVCNTIRQRVADGELKPGDKLPAERELAEQLGVSRNGVREALRSLEMSGVLEFRRGVLGGAFIREVSSSGVQASISDMLAIGKISLGDLSETRASLLATAVRFACERGTSEDFARLEKNIERSSELEDGHDVAAMIDTITEFYVLLGNSAHNGVLKILIEAVTVVARDLLVKLNPPDTANMAAIRYRLLVALRARDSASAERLMLEHMHFLHRYVAQRGGASFMAEDLALASPGDAVAPIKRRRSNQAPA